MSLPHPENAVLAQNVVVVLIGYRGNGLPLPTIDEPVMRRDYGWYSRNDLVELVREALDLSGPDAAAQSALGETLSSVRLAMTALDLGSGSEANEILSRICGYLVDRGAVDPLAD